MRRPITQKAKSPLKQTGPVLEKSETSTSAGEDIISEVDSSEDPGKASGGRQTTDAEGYLATLKKRFPNSTGQQLVDGGYISGAYADRFPSSFTEKNITPGKTTTETKTNFFSPQTRDETTAITPWENRFNMRTSRQSERFARNEAKRDLRRNANEASRRARRDDDMSYGESRQLKRGIMKGDNLDDKQQTLYDASRGQTAEANRVFSTDAQQSQFEQAAVRGEKVLGKRRDMDMYDYGTAKGAATVKTLQDHDPDYKVKLGSNEKVTTTGGGAKSANAGAPTTNKVNGTGASSKAAMRPSVGLNAEFKGASVPSAPDLVAAKKARQVAQADATMPDAATAPSKDADVKAAEKSARQATRANNKQARMANRGQVDKDGNVITRKQMRQNKKAGQADYKARKEFDEAVNQVAANANKSESNLESVPEAPDNVKFSGNEIIADRKAKALAQANSMKQNTGTADRSSYNRTSPGLSDGTPTRKDSDRSVISAAQMRYESNVGVKKSTPMKKGYFKGK